VLLNIEDRSKVRAIGGVSFDESGLNLGPLMDAPVIRERIEQAIRNPAEAKAKSYGPPAKAGASH
jgi:2-oxoglutarate ferredoxin oxidoreductase subunit alpha